MYGQIPYKWYDLKVKARKANPAKSSKVKAARGFSPEEVAANGELLDVKPCIKDADIEYEIYYFQNYVWVVVCGKKPQRFVTTYKSRKFKREYGK